MEQSFFAPGGFAMTEVTLQLEPGLALFYTKIAAVSGKELPQVLSDALFKLAGELSLQALKQNNLEITL